MQTWTKQFFDDDYIISIIPNTAVFGPTITYRVLSPVLLLRRGWKFRMMKIMDQKQARMKISDDEDF